MAEKKSQVGALQALKAELKAKTGWEIPQPLASLRDKEIRFTGGCSNDKASMQATVYQMLKLD